LSTLAPHPFIVALAPPAGLIEFRTQQPSGASDDLDARIDLAALEDDAALCDVSLVGTVHGMVAALDM